MIMRARGIYSIAHLSRCSCQNGDAVAERLVNKLFRQYFETFCNFNPMVARGNYVGRLPDYFALFMKIRFQCSDTPVESQDMKKPSTNYIFSRRQ